MRQRRLPPLNKQSPKLPARLMLPSGMRVGLDDRAARMAAQTLAKSVGDRCCEQALLDQLAVLRAPGVLCSENGKPLDVMGLSLRDANVLRAFLGWAGITGEIEEQYSCLNCKKTLVTSPDSLLQIAPFIDGELGDRELDAPFAFDAWHPIPPLRAGKSVARRIRFSDRRVEEAWPLWIGLAQSKDLPALTPAMVLAMGIRAMDREHRLSAMTDALCNATPLAWNAIVNLFLEAHYSRRLIGIYRCGECGAKNEIELPWAREFGGSGDLETDLNIPTRRMKQRPPFPSLDDFEARVRRAANRIYRKLGVRKVDLYIDGGVPACDDGGHPLLGSYQPGTPPNLDLEIHRRPEIRIYYQSFEAEYQCDPFFDIDHEIAETIEHELTHHLHQLAGVDPLDDEEHAEIEMEHARTVGKKETLRRYFRQLGGDFWGFVKATWILWALLLLSTKLLWCP